MPLIAYRSSFSQPTPHSPTHPPCTTSHHPPQYGSGRWARDVIRGSTAGFCSLGFRNRSVLFFEKIQDAFLLPAPAAGRQACCCTGIRDRSLADATETARVSLLPNLRLCGCKSTGAGLQHGSPCRQRGSDRQKVCAEKQARMYLSFISARFACIGLVQ